MLLFFSGAPSSAPEYLYIGPSLRVTRYLGAKVDADATAVGANDIVGHFVWA